MKLSTLDFGSEGIGIIIDNVVIARAPTLELAKQEAGIVLSDLQLMLLTLEIEK